MTAVLVRIGIDHAYGHWNAPVNADGRFVYVPIPERTTEFHPGLARHYREVLSPLRAFGRGVHADYRHHTKLPRTLHRRPMHLDPDFCHLTYGDVGHRRGKTLSTMTGGDLVVFYAGLRPTHACEHRLIYALVGLYVVDEVVTAESVPMPRRHENAHTRKLVHGPTDIVVRARRGVSGRFDRAVPIGHYRENAYRVRPDVLNAWGGLTVKNGYIHLSGVPPRFLDPVRFLEWFGQQGVTLVAENH